MLAVNAPTAAPIQPGDPARFWLAACDVKLLTLDADARRAPTFLPDGFEGARIVDGWAYYERPHLHGSFLYALPLDAALADFDEVLDSLETARRDGAARPAVVGYATWRDDVSIPRSAERLLGCIAEARREEHKRNDALALAGDWLAEEYFWRRWRHSHWFWANLTFEWLYLTGLALFAVWPGYRGGSIYRWSAHLAALPLLFFLPAYLGYGSGFWAGPDGSVLYPRLLHGMKTYAPYGPLDEWVLRRAPQALEPLSSGPLLPQEIHRRGLAPTAALLLGGAASGALLLGYLGFRAWRERGPRNRGNGISTRLS